jgi:hypothetical protein
MISPLLHSLQEPDLQPVKKENPARVSKTLVEAQNYTRISVSGKTGERKLTVEFLGIKGEINGMDHYRKGIEK